jgi:hypothetical protein
MEKGQQMRFTDSELDLIRRTFKGNETLLKLLRKVFLPEIDPDAPLGQTIDLWMTIPVNQLPPDQAVINLLARNQLIMHIEQQLLQLQKLAEIEEETEEEKKERIKKDSVK